MMMMVTKVRTGFEVVQLHSCDEDLLAVLHARMRIEENNNS